MQETNRGHFATCKNRNSQNRCTKGNSTYCKALQSRTHQLQIRRSKQWPSIVRGLQIGVKREIKMKQLQWRREAETKKEWKITKREKKGWRDGAGSDESTAFESGRRPRESKEKTIAKIDSSAEELSSQQKQEFDVRRTSTAAHISVSFVQ